jgi:4-hydroxyphenylpyruvate dioxygenase
VAVDGQRSLIYLLDQLRRTAGWENPAFPLLPARSACHGVEFIEFAMDEASAPSLEAMLRALGFRKAGTHKSKAVTRWRQGDINAVINCEKEGFAHAFNITHGSSVCAIGLKVDDANAAMERARRLLDQPFRQAVGPGELEMPAVRGLEGSLIYFLDAGSRLAKVWEIEFEPIAEADEARPLKAIDHISQSMRYDEMLSWLLFYTSLLEVTKTPAQEVIDPGGVVQSQVVETQDGRLRIVLNASQSQRTLSARFLSELFGSGVQHIAFASSDIFAAAARFAAAGARVLPIPENYYDDLEARGELEPEQIERMKASNILYDRDGDTEYLQFYTQNFEDKFFFEVVERRGYRGFGATNAPIRLAAQTRLARHLAVPRK